MVYLSDAFPGHCWGSVGRIFLQICNFEVEKRSFEATRATASFQSFALMRSVLD